LGIESLLERYPKGLSGGERQRVAIARALSFHPQLLCLDEPLSSLDDATRTRLLQVLRDVHQREQITILHITHNLAEGNELGTIHFELKNGKVTDA
jgi:ABC-type molybdate transport system ATPase subunit